LDVPKDLAHFQAHSDTSREAAVAIHEDVVGRRRSVLRFVRAQGRRGVTGRELADHFRHREGDDQVTSWHPRLVELADAGLLVKLERKRANVTGKPAHVYVVPEAMGADDRPAPPPPPKSCPHCGGEL
jgi:hypothetical protein